LLLAALVPPGVVTVIPTTPEDCAGASAFSWVEDTNVTDAEAAEPNATLAPDTNPDPLITTVFPPAGGPAFGATLVTAGSEEVTVIVPCMAAYPWIVQ
jgi:hypothetical protein